MMKRFLYTLLLIAAVSLTACTAVAEPAPVANEAAAYTAVIRQIYTENDTFGGTLQPTAVYLLSHTDDAVGDPETTQLPGQPIGAATQEAITAALADLPAEWIWVDSRDDVPLNPGTGGVEGAERGAIITLGNLHEQPDGSLHVPAGIYVGNLAAGGQTFVLEQTADGWAVTGTTGMGWIS
jgi:hypothetical protein